MNYDILTSHFTGMFDDTAEYLLINYIPTSFPQPSLILSENRYEKSELSSSFPPPPYL